MHASLIGRKRRYELDFSGKFNIICGASATRKTEFLKSLIKYKNGIKSIKCNVTIDGIRLRREQIFLYSNESANAEIYKKVMLEKTNCLFVIDESSDILKDREVSSVFKNSMNYFLIISRNMFGWLPISIDSVYEFEDQKGVIVNRPRYCKHNDELTEIGKVDYILTEDGASSRLFFRHHFSQEVCNRTFMYDGKEYERDNSTLHLALKSDLDRYGHILVAFDASAYGFFYQLLLDAIDGASVSVLAWDSYENYLLQCPKFGVRLTKDDVGCSYNSLEQLSVEKLTELLKGYTKSRLPGELKETSFVQEPLTHLLSK